MANQVTAVIPAFNGARWIRRSIDSVFAQTRPASELIIVDDGSTDETADIVRSYGPRVRYIYQPNRGVAAARNRAIEAATSEWVAFLDQDDEWLPGKLESQVQLLEANPNAALSYSAYWLHDLHGNRTLVRQPIDKLRSRIRLEPPFPPSVVMIRKAELLKLGGFDEKLRGASCEDWDLFIRFLRSYEAVEMPKPLANYYEVESSSSRNYRLMLPNTLSIVDGSLLAGLTGLRRIIWRRRIKGVLYYRAAISAREFHEPANRYLVQSFWQWPFPDLMPRRFKTALVCLLRP